ncbi:MAG: LemA family protein [Candidatus Gastranaerophilaceae bacterium]
MVTLCVPTIIGLLVLLAILAVLYNLYVQLIQKRNKVKEAMGGIDVQLEKRYDLIPNILTIAKKFMEHERGLMDEITKLRSRAAGLQSTAETISEKINLDNAIASRMGQLMVSVENYPQLKSDQTMLQAMQTYSEVEEHIAAARRFYNSAVNELNNAVEIFPSSMIAGMLGIRSYPFFEAKEAARNAVNASDFLK